MYGEKEWLRIQSKPGKCVIWIGYHVKLPWWSIITFTWLFFFCCWKCSRKGRSSFTKK